MEGNIFKPEITKEKMKRKLELLMERLENTKEDEISKINDEIVEMGMMNRPDLEELVKRELLELIPEQIENEFSMSDAGSQSSLKIMHLTFSVILTN